MIKIFKFILIILLYQSPLHSKSTSFNNFNSKDLSNYFSGIVASENRMNSEALKFFNSSKNLLYEYDPFLQRYVTTLVLEKKIDQAISIIKKNIKNENIDFFDAYLLLIIDRLKEDDIEKAYEYLNTSRKFVNQNRFDAAIFETLNQYLYTFKEKKFISKKKNFGNLSFIADTFLRCYLADPKTEVYFSNLINKSEADYSRYIYFYLSYLIENKKFDVANELAQEINYINSTLLLSQGKSWIESEDFKKFESVFSCKNYNHIISEFLFLISNLYSSQDNYERSNFYSHLSNYLNPEFIYNLSLVVENYYFKKDYEISKKILRNFKKNDEFYFWYRIKKEAQIIAKQKNQEKSIDFISSEFKKIYKPNNKMIFDLANFYKNAKDYKTAITYYSIVIENLKNDSEIKSGILYRRGGSYERLGDYDNSDKDLLASLSINSEDAYVLNYLAYSWLERNYKIKDAIKMLEKAYSIKKEDPYIIDSIGWAYYLINDYHKAEKFLKQAVELMPDDPVVNDHYGDILWKLNQKIQARYFWNNVLKMEDVEEDMINKIKDKLIYGPKNV